MNGTEQFNADVDQATGKGRSLANAIGNGLQVASKIGTAAVAAAATGVGLLTKSSLENYAEYEQLVGGVETLFKNNSETVKAYAENAFKSAGLSANEYMSTVTSFSASLLQGLGGNTAEAAKIADLAITDMADNANKMGTSMEAIQNAYQGFAKQNYTMLDNLKLGYGGTASEMARLINESGVLGETMTVTAETVNSVSFDKMIKAIHVVQTQMGITGTTAKEASSTISGSVAAAKSAWSNLVTGIADENANMEALIANFADSASTALGNIVPRIGQIVSGLEAVGEQVPVLGMLGNAIKATAAILVASKIGAGLQTIVAGFQTAQLQLSLYAAANGTAALATGAMTGALTAKEVVVGVLTGKISLATAAQAAWNAVMSANPIGLVLVAVTALAAGMVKLSKVQDDTIAAMAGTAATAEEAAAKVSELQSKIEALEATDPAFWSDMQQTEYDTLRLALAEAQSQYDALKAAEEGAAESATLPAEAVSQSTQETIDSMNNLLASYQETYTQIFENVGQWFEPFEAAKTTVTTSVADMMAAMQSQIEFNNTYSQNIQALADYGLGTLATAFQSYGAEGSAYAATIVSAVEQAGGATSAGGQAIINSFAELQAGVAESQGELAASMTEMSGEFDAALSAMVDSLSASVDGLDKSAEAYAAAMSTLGEYLAGVEAQTPSILAAMTALGQQITAALQAGIGVVTVPTVTAGVGMTGRSAAVGQYATGLDYVPYDNFPAYLHEGEMVVPAGQADFLRAGGFAQATSEQNATIVAVLSQILSAVQNVDISNAFNGVALNVNNREFARMVKAVN